MQPLYRWNIAFLVLQCCFVLSPSLDESHFFPQNVLSGSVLGQEPWKKLGATSYFMPVPRASRRSCAGDPSYTSDISSLGRIPKGALQTRAERSKVSPLFRTLKRLASIDAPLEIQEMYTRNALKKIGIDLVENHTCIRLGTCRIKSAESPLPTAPAVIRINFLEDNYFYCTKFGSYNILHHSRFDERVDVREKRNDLTARRRLHQMPHELDIFSS